MKISAIIRGASRKYGMRLRFIERAKREHLPAGRYPVEKDMHSFRKCETRSFEEADFEIHKNYFDMQVLLEGEGNVGVRRCSRA